MVPRNGNLDGNRKKGWVSWFVRPNVPTFTSAVCVYTVVCVHSSGSPKVSVKNRMSHMGSTGVQVCGGNSAGWRSSVRLVGWRIHTGTVEGPLLNAVTSYHVASLPMVDT